MHSKNLFLTFDVEEFYNSELISRVIGDNIPDYTSLETNIDKLLSLCATYNIKATWFILGEVAEKKPQIVKKIYNYGHEIASHSFSHKLVYNMTPSEFRYDLIKSLSILEDLIGEKVIGYRAPSWSVKDNMLNWFYDILIENGIKYSSSVFPGKTFLYGIPGASDNIQRPIIEDTEKDIIEIPQYLMRFFSFKFGFSGGFYMRLFPYWLIKYFINKALLDTTYLFFYLHPYEIDDSIPKLKLRMLHSFIQYYNIKNNLGKFEKILRHYRYNFIELRNINYNV